LKKKVQFLEVGLKNNKLDLRQLMVKLGKMSITSLLIEGGGTVASNVLSEGIVNKILYFMAPKLLGGSDGIAVFEGKGVKKLADAVVLRNMSVKLLDTDILVQGYIK